MVPDTGATAIPEPLPQLSHSSHSAQRLQLLLRGLGSIAEAAQGTETSRGLEERGQKSPPHWPCSPIFSSGYSADPLTFRSAELGQARAISHLGRAGQAGVYMSSRRPHPPLVSHAYTSGGETASTLPFPSPSFQPLLHAEVSCGAAP